VERKKKEWVERKERGDFFLFLNNTEGIG